MLQSQVRKQTKHSIPSEIIMKSQYETPAPLIITAELKGGAINTEWNSDLFHCGEQKSKLINVVY